MTSIAMFNKVIAQNCKLQLTKVRSTYRSMRRYQWHVNKSYIYLFFVFGTLNRYGFIDVVNSVISNFMFFQSRFLQNISLIDNLRPFRVKDALRGDDFCTKLSYIIKLHWIQKSPVVTLPVYCHISSMGCKMLLTLNIPSPSTDIISDVVTFYWNNLTNLTYCSAICLCWLYAFRV